MVRIILLLMVLLIMIKPATIQANAPYFTYTEDDEQKAVQTQTAYVPIEQIRAINGMQLEMPEHVFIDDDDLIYVTDSGHNKVFILDEHYRYIAELEHDIFNFVKSTFVTEDRIYVVDIFESKIFVFDKETHELLEEIGEPDSPVFHEGYSFNPTHIAVDIRGNIYVRSDGSVNGLIMLNREGEFITFFGANPLRVPLLDQIRSLFLTKEQKNKLEKVFPDVPSDLAIDERGFIYTATSSVEKAPIKKFNVSGTNYFPDEIFGTYNTASVWVGRFNNVFSVSEDGWIFEYDSNGNLLFLFGGKDFNSNRLGLLNRPVSIATNTQDEIVVIDQGNKLIQTYEPTQFANTVHQAMHEYQIGNYENSKALWGETLKYNSTFDIAHAGLGSAYLREGEIEQAYDEFYIIEDKEGISESFWELRQAWLSNHLDKVLMILIIALALWYTHRYFKYRYDYNAALIEKLSTTRNVKVIDDFVYIFSFLKSPLNGIYEIKEENRVSPLSATLIYGLLIAIYILHHKFTNILFVPRNEYIIYELFIIIFLFVLWMISTYLICSINDGEGTFMQVYNATAYALTPILVIMPVLIVVSQWLTLEQNVFYQIPIYAIFIWVAILMFFMVKDLHNYEVGETFSIFFKGLFTMLIIGLFLFVVYSLGNQLLGFLGDVITEVSRR